MPFTLTNSQPTGPLHVPLTSGASVRLAPGETSAELPDVEVDGNDVVAKLRRRGALQVRPVEQGGGGRSRSGRQAKKDSSGGEPAPQET